jgi:hypothetical protein
VLAIDHLGGGEAGIDFDTERFRLGGEPAADIAERADIAAMVVHQRRHQEIRQPHAGRAGHPVEMVIGDLRLQRTIGILAPARQQLVETGRIDDGAGQDMGADLGALFHHHHAEIGVELLQADGRAQAGRTGADDDNVEFHGFARRQRLGCHWASRGSAGY